MHCGASVNCLGDSVARADHVFSVDMLASVHLSELLVSYEGRTFICVCEHVVARFDAQVL